MARGGDKSRIEGERRCLIEGSGQSRHGMIRFVLDPSARLTADINEKLPGRGVWVTATREHLETAVKKDLFSRGFRQKVETSATLVDDIENALVARLQSLIALARKSGYAVAGAEKTRDALQMNENVVLFQASDGSAREKRNIGPRDAISSHFEILSKDEMGMAFGRDNVVHIALTGRGLRQTIEKEANRLLGLRMLEASPTRDKTD